MRAVRRAARALAGCALLPLLLSSCSDATGLGGMIDGTASVTASGAASASGSGLAVFQSVTSGSTSLFQIVVTPVTTSAAGWQVQIVNYDGRLGEGTYHLAPLAALSGDPTANFYVNDGASMQMFNATDGTLEITSSSPSGVRGSFTFTAANTSGSGTVTVEGTFAAKCVPGTTCQ